MRTLAGECPGGDGADQAMIEFLRNATIVVMGLTVIGAGVFVVFYG